MSRARETRVFLSNGARVVMLHCNADRFVAVIGAGRSHIHTLPGPINFISRRLGLTMRTFPVDHGETLGWTPDPGFSEHENMSDAQVSINDRGFRMTIPVSRTSKHRSISAC